MNPAIIDAQVFVDDKKAPSLSRLSKVKEVNKPTINSYVLTIFKLEIKPDHVKRWRCIDRLILRNVKADKNKYWTTLKMLARIPPHQFSC